MRHFRVGSELAHINGGFKECFAPSPASALAHFIARGWSGGHAHLQERVNGWWHFVVDPGHIGKGYEKHGSCYLWDWH